MTYALTSNDGAPDLAIREPAPAEAERVLHLFGNIRLPSHARLLAAARNRPIERFIAAAAWWPDGTVGRFQIVCQPGVERASVAGNLFDKLAECARLAGMATLQSARLFDTEDEWFGLLQTYGFQSLHSERSFEVAYDNAWNRVMRLHQKYGAQVPAGWRTDSIRHHPPETALDLIGAHHLMPPGEVRDYWLAKSQFGFDLDLSCLLFDRQQPCGAFLSRRMGDVYYVDVRVMRETNSRLRSLGNLFMMQRMFMAHHYAQLAGSDAPIRWLRFRSGATEHRETASLALRMGGRELAQEHLMAKAL